MIRMSLSDLSTMYATSYITVYSYYSLLHYSLIYLDVATAQICRILACVCVLGG